MKSTLFYKNNSSPDSFKAKISQHIDVIEITDTVCYKKYYITFVLRRLH